MSFAGYSEQEKMYKKPFHQRNDSGELDVFEAARYFSGYNNSNNNEVLGHNNINGIAASTKSAMRDRDDNYRQPWRTGGGGGARISLDMPMRNSNSILQNQSHGFEKQNMKNDKKYKQPSSPGGRLASFLNSLFNQTASKKKKSKSTKDEDEESPVSGGGGGGGRRKRRSSISHFRFSSTTTTADSKSSIYSSSSSGFRTPPASSSSVFGNNTPKPKIYKDLRSYSDNNHKQSSLLSVSISKQNGGHLRSSALHKNVVFMDDEDDGNDKTRSRGDLSWLDEKFKFSNGISSEKKNRKMGNSENEFRYFKNGRMEDEDDGAESDSSSDLFELQNYELGGNLPVYETTSIESIKTGPPISNCTH